jgi:hypothetical protein
MKYINDASSNLDQAEVYNIMCESLSATCDKSIVFFASFELLVLLYLYACFICLVVFNATFNYISVISWRSVFWVEETGGPCTVLKCECQSVDKLGNI